MLLGIDLSKRTRSLFSESMAFPIVATICAAAAARRGFSSSSSWGRFASALTSTMTTPATLALCGNDKNSDRHHSARSRRAGLYGRRSFARDRAPPVRRTTTDVVGRSTIGVFTPITASLWIERLQREAGATLPPKPAEGPLPPSASAVAVSYDFTTDANLTELYRNPWGGVRIGRVLEDLDSLAGSIALNHFDGSCHRTCGSSSEWEDSPREDGQGGERREKSEGERGQKPRRRPPVLVTASVDAIKLLSPLSIEQDVEARGQVVYTGKSSMDIRLELYSVAANGTEEAGGGEQEQEAASAPSTPTFSPSPALIAHFTFACRDENNRPMAIPQLAPETDVDRQRFEERAALAEERRRRRQAKAAAAAEASSALSNSRTFSSSISKSFSSSLSMPIQAHGLSGKASGLSAKGSGLSESHEAQIEAVADLLLRESAAAADLPALASGDAIPSRLTSAGNTFMCQPQQRNITGRVFGGFLMRKAFELAFASCYVHCGFRPKFLELERVEFMAPVAVGDLLRLRGKVLHVSSSSSSEVTVRVRVRADVVKPEQAASEISNTFIFAFQVPLRGGAGEAGARSVKRVLPDTREEALAAAAYEVVV